MRIATSLNLIAPVIAASWIAATLLLVPDASQAKRPVHAGIQPESDFLACVGGCVGDPISAGSGNLYEGYTDYESKGTSPLVFFRAYNSLIAEENSSPDGAFENLGRGWTSKINRHLFISVSPMLSKDPDTGRSYVMGRVIGVTLWNGDGSHESFYYRGSGASIEAIIFSNERRTTGELKVASMKSDGSIGSFVYRREDGSVESYDGAGKLTSVTDGHGLRQLYQYDAKGDLASITNPFGRALKFGYDAGHRLTSVIDPAGGVISYTYDSLDNLIAVSFPDKTQLHYLYENASLPHALTAAIDQDGNRYVSWSFDSQGRAVSSKLGDGTHDVHLIYNPDGTTDVSEVGSTDRHLTFTSVNGRQMMATSSTAASPSSACGGCNVKALTYDKNGFVENETDFNGNVTHYTHDSVGHETSRTVQSATGNNPIAATALAQPYYDYDARGLLMSATDPTGVKVSLSYDSQGNLAQIKDSDGKITRIPQYDAHGNPLTIIGPTGDETDYVYDVEQHMVSRTASGHKIDYRYDGVGQLTKIIVASGAYVEFVYNAGHHLTTLDDSLGDTVEFALDKHGVPIGERVYNKTQGSLAPPQILAQLNGILR